MRQAYASGGRSSALSRRVRCRARSRSLNRSTRSCEGGTSRRSASCCRAGTTRCGYEGGSTSTATPAGRGRNFWCIGSERRRALVGPTVSLCIRSPDAPHLSILIPVRARVRADIVEGRNVEAGSMSQVIQVNNLCCMFTDTPPSLQQACPRMSRGSLSPYNNGSGGGFASHAQAHSSFPAYGQQLVSVYPGQLPTPPVYPGHQPPHPYERSMGGREEHACIG